MAERCKIMGIENLIFNSFSFCFPSYTYSCKRKIDNDDCTYSTIDPFDTWGRNGIKNETMALIDSILLPSPSSLAFSTSANSFSESATQPQPHQHRKQILAQSFHALNRLNACNTEESERDASDERISQWTQRLLLHEDEEGNDDVWLRDGEVMNAFVALVESQ